MTLEDRVMAIELVLSQLLGHVRDEDPDMAASILVSVNAIADGETDAVQRAVQEILGDLH